MQIFNKILLLLSSSEKKQFILLQIGATFLALFEMVSIALIAPFMSLLVQPDLSQQPSVIQNIHRSFGEPPLSIFVVYFGIVVLLCFIFTNICIVLINWLIYHFTFLQGSRIANRLFRNYLFRDYLFFTSHNTAELSRTIFQDVSRLRESIITPLLVIFGRIVSVLAILVLLALMDWKVTLCAFVIFVGSYAAIYFGVRHILRNTGDRLVSINNRRFRTVSEALGGIKDCKINGAERYFATAFEDSTYEDAHNQTKRRTLMIIPRYLIEALAISALIGFSLLLYTKENHGEIIATLSLFAIATYKLMPSLQNIYGNIALIRSDLNALDLIINDMSIADRTDEVLKDEIAEDFPFEKEIKIENLNFSYPSSKKQVLKNLDLIIPCRKTVGIAGVSGSGKSTLIDILLGLLEQQEGEIVVDETTLNKSNVASWQSQLGYVPQSIHLVDGTLAENVAFGVAPDEIDRELVYATLQDAQMQSFVDNELEDGIDSELGEKGVRLSGGQRQRIGIARALYRKPKVLIFDEATSALDGPTELRIIDAVNELSGKMTIIMIAHRLTTLKGCDVIYIIDEGRSTENGTYTKLMDSSLYFQSSLMEYKE